MRLTEGRTRIIIEGVKPAIDGGRFPIKRTVGERVEVEADIFVDGHDSLSGLLLYRPETESQWHEVTLAPAGNDRWRGRFTVSQIGRYRFTLQAWVDHFQTWRAGLMKKAEAGQNVSIDLLVGATMIDEAYQRVTGDDAVRLQKWAATLRTTEELGTSAAAQLALDEELAKLMARHPDRRFAASYEKELPVIVDREKARFSAWYEIFPRSCAVASGHHGTFEDCEARLPYIAKMGFDVLYLPPIHHDSPGR